MLSSIRGAINVYKAEVGQETQGKSTLINRGLNL